MLKTIVSDFIFNGEFIANKMAWSELNSKYTREEIKNALIEHILVDEIKFPYVPISEEECKQEFLDMKNSDIIDFSYADNIDIKYPLEHKTSNLYLKIASLGNKASNYFHQVSRMKCGHNKCISPSEVWKSKEDLFKCLNALWTLKYDEIKRDTFMRALNMRYYVAAQFKPIIAKSIYTMFNARKVLDTSSGWGDRLCGFFACENTESYLGVDPNTSLHDGYNKQIEFYNSLIDKKKSARVICDGAENLNFKDYGTFDFVFTSPPYFNTEHYSNDEKECWLKFKSDNDWLNNFLFVWMKNANDALEENGYIVVNISDIVTNGKRVLICDPMIEFATKELGMNYIGEFAMAMTPRANVINKVDKGTVYGEPVFVFKKGEPSTDEYSVDYQIMNNKINKPSIFDMF